MLQFFRDQSLTRPATPVWILAARRGSVKRMSLWLADTYSTYVAEDAAAGATSLKLGSSLGLPAFGSVFCGGAEIAYSAVNAGVLTVDPLAAPVSTGDLVYPKLTYSGDTSLTIFPRGPVAVRLKRDDQVQYGIPNTAVVYPFSEEVSANTSGPRAIARVDIQVSIPAGDDGELPELSLVTNPLVSDGEGALAEPADVSFRVVRGSLGLPQRVRLVPADRILDPKRPGFVWGSYRWRDDREANAHPLVPSRWDLDVNLIGREKFVSGAGDGLDLAPVSVEKNLHSLYARVRSGFYWCGPDRHYMPSDDAATVISPIEESGGSVQLGAATRRQKPLFVGAFKLDHEGYYDTLVRYEYMHAGFDPAGPEYQFTLDRSQNIVRLNKGFALGRLFLGVAPDAESALFDLPVHPVGVVTAVTLGPTGNSPETPVSSYEIDREAGTIRITFDDPVESAGRDLYVDCSPAVAVVFERKSASQQDTLVAPVDLNPAFAGIGRGYLYLEHRKQRVASIQLACDKPRIVSPAGHELQISYGPVFYGDFALLQAAAFSPAGDPVPGARLRIATSGMFEGSINYQDPVQTAVTVVTGGDGVATFIYTPPAEYGVYLAPSSVVNGVVTLPAPIPLEQLWNAGEGWLARIYAVYNNDPVFGKVGANSEYGEMPWRQTGAPGSASFRTNGKRVAVSDNGAAALPVAGYDASGNSTTDPGFDGTVARLEYDSLPSGATIGAYFLAMVGRIQLCARAEDEGVSSNFILLDLETPPEIVDESGLAGYLRVNTGRLNVNRLGGAPIVISPVTTSRY